LLARDAVTRGHVPTSAVTASIVGAMEVQEAFKLLHGQPTLDGEGLHFDGLHGDSSRVRYQRRQDCLGHENLGPLRSMGFGAKTPISALLERAEQTYGEGASLDLSRDVIARLSCPSCGDSGTPGAVVGAVRETQAACKRCGTHRVVEIAASIRRDDNLDLSLSLADLGLPPFDIVVARDGMERQEAWLLDADAPDVLGELAESYRGKQGTT
jgi:adenylyltransferase/sulfurtransferase